MKSSIYNSSELLPDTKHKITSNSDEFRIRSSRSNPNHNENKNENEYDCIAVSVYIPIVKPTTNDVDEDEEINEINEVVFVPPVLPSYIIAVLSTNNTIQNIKKLQLLTLRNWSDKYPNIKILYFIGNYPEDSVKQVSDTLNELHTYNIVKLNCSDDNSLHSSMKCKLMFEYIRDLYPNIEGVFYSKIHDIPYIIEYIPSMLETHHHESYFGLDTNLIEPNQNINTSDSPPIVGIQSMCTINVRTYYNMGYDILYPEMSNSYNTIECEYFSTNVYISMDIIKNRLLCKKSNRYFEDITNKESWKDYLYKNKKTQSIYPRGNCVYTCLPVHDGYSIAYVLTVLHDISPVVLSDQILNKLN
jgi:hypothetical protein